MASKLDQTLPGEHYSNERHFAAERGGIFHAEWFCVGRREGLEAKGNYRLINVAGEACYWCAMTHRLSGPLITFADTAVRNSSGPRMGRNTKGVSKPASVALIIPGTID